MIRPEEVAMIMAMDAAYREEMGEMTKAYHERMKEAQKHGRHR